MHKIYEILQIKGEFTASLHRWILWQPARKNEKKSALKGFIKRPVLLDPVNVTTIFFPGL